MMAPTLPLFGPIPPPVARATLDGWKYGDACLLADERNLGQWRKARVIAVRPRAHVLTLRAERPDAIVEVQLPHFANKLRRPE
jgi:hypothetical protein